MGDISHEKGRTGLKRTPFVRRSRYRLRNWAGRYPRIYLPVARWQLRDVPEPINLAPGQWDPDSRRAVDGRVEIVIEGFPRSANGFAVTALKHAQKRPIWVAHHLHLPAQVIEGRNKGLPVLVVVRKPNDAVASLIVRQPYLTARQGFTYYARFHEALLPLRDELVVATFEEVTRNFGAVTKRVNALCGSRFEVFEHTEENVAGVFASLEQRNIRGAGRGRVSESMVSRPSEERARLKKLIEQKVHDPRLESVRSRASIAYEQLVGAAARPSSSQS